MTTVASWTLERPRRRREQSGRSWIHGWGFEWRRTLDNFGRSLCTLWTPFFATLGGSGLFFFAQGFSSFFNTQGTGTSLGGIWWRWLGRGSTHEQNWSWTTGFWPLTPRKSCVNGVGIATKPYQTLPNSCLKDCFEPLIVDFGFSIESSGHNKSLGLSKQMLSHNYSYHVSIWVAIRSFWTLAPGRSDDSSPATENAYRSMAQRLRERSKGSRLISWGSSATVSDRRKGIQKQKKWPGDVENAGMNDVLYQCFVVS